MKVRLTSIDKLIIAHLKINPTEYVYVKCTNIYKNFYRCNFVHYDNTISHSFWAEIVNDKIISCVKD